MGIQIGPWDPLQLSFQIINGLLKNGTFTPDQAKAVLKDTLPKDMNEEEKNRIVNSMVVNQNQNV